MDTMTFLDKLNPQQRQVCVNEGNILLKACPGSGKTRTLTYKLAYSVQKYMGDLVELQRPVMNCRKSLE